MYEKLRRIDELPVKNKTIVVRADFDIPIIASQLSNTAKIKAVVKTINYLLSNNCKVVIISHTGNPDGEEDHLSLMEARFELGKLLGIPIKFAHIHACENSIKFMEQSEVLLLENLKFHPEEYQIKESAVREFYKPVIDLCDYYVFEAFGVNEDLASTTTLIKVMDSVAGFHTIEEVENLNILKKESKKPYVSIIGGKVDDQKLGLLDKMIEESDFILLGGLISYQFLHAKDVSIGKSLFDKKYEKAIKELIKKAKAQKSQIILPVDHICVEEREENAKPIKVDTQQIPAEYFGMDIGDQSLVMFREIIESAQTIYWEGAVGMYEWENFNRGTEAIGEYIALSAPREALKFANGNSASHAMEILKIKAKRFNHVSLGDRVTASFLSGQKIKPLELLKK